MAFPATYDPANPPSGLPGLAPKPKPKPKSKPKPVDPLLTQATASVDAGVEATLAAIRAEQERAEKAARDQAAQIGQFTTALAEVLKGIGPQIQAGYQTAANTQATFGKGYSDAMKAIQSGNATDTNSFLQNVVGAPAGQQIPGEKATAAADVLYGLGGRIPSGLFAAQGAGYGEAAAGYPMQAGVQGQFLAAQELGRGAEERARYQALIDEQIGKRPELIEAAVEKLRKERDAAAKERYEQALDLYNADLLTQRGLAQALGLPGWKKYPQVTKNQEKFAADERYRQATLAQKDRSAALSLARDMTRATGILYVPGPDGVPTEVVDGQENSVTTLAWADKQFNQKYKQAQLAVSRGNLALSQKRLTVEQLNKAGLDAAGNLLPGYQRAPDGTIVPRTSTKKKPQVSPDELADAREFAAARATAAYNGFFADRTARPLYPVRFPGVPGSPKARGDEGYSIPNGDGTYNNWVPPLSYPEAVKKIVQMPQIQRLPANTQWTVVQQALNRLYKPGERGRPKQTERSTRRKTGPEGAAALALDQVGKPYQWGGEDISEGGYDCSGLIDWAYRQVGIDFPGRLTTYTAMKVGRAVDPNTEQLKPGDLIITNGGEHMVMYIGGGEVVAASGSRGEVRGNRGGKVVRQAAQYHLDRAVAIRRVIENAPTTATSTTGGPQKHPDYVYDPQRKVWFNVETGETWKGPGAP